MSVIYEAMSSSDSSVEWRVLFRRNAARPRTAFTTWLTYHGMLVTKSRPKRFNMITDSNCSFYHNKEESIAHLFFACRYTFEIWKQILHWLNVSHQLKPWTEELKWVMQYVAKKGWKASILKMAFIETLHGIWLRRNEVVFLS